MVQWPMINLRAREAERAAQMFANKKGLDESEADQLFFEKSGISSTNKEVANILDKSDPKQSSDSV
jgi:hypothetical protein